jgi:hypothetical protein
MMGGGGGMGGGGSYITAALNILGGIGLAVGIGTRASNAESAADDIRDLLVNTRFSIEDIAAGLNFDQVDISPGELIFPYQNPTLGNAALSGLTFNSLVGTGMPVSSASVLSGSPMAQAVNVAGTLGLRRRQFNEALEELRNGLDTRRTQRIAAAMGLGSAEELYAAQESFESQVPAMIAAANAAQPGIFENRLASYEGLAQITSNFVDTAAANADQFQSMVTNSLAQVPAAQQAISGMVPFGQAGAMAALIAADQMGVPLEQAGQIMNQLSGLFEDALAVGPVTREDILGREAAIAAAMTSELDERTAEQVASAMELANARGVNPAAILGEIEQERMIQRQAIEAEDALARALGLYGGIEQLRLGSLAGTVGAGTAALDAAIQTAAGLAGQSGAYGQSVNAIGDAQQMGLNWLSSLLDTAGAGINLPALLGQNIAGGLAFGQGDLTNAANLYNAASNTAGSIAGNNASLVNDILASQEFFNAQQSTGQQLAQAGMNTQALMLGMQGGLADIQGDLQKANAFSEGMDAFINSYMGSM